MRLKREDIEKPDMLRKINLWIKCGKTRHRIAEMLGCTDSAFYKMIERSEMLKEAVENGDAWEEISRERNEKERETLLSVEEKRDARRMKKEREKKEPKIFVHRSDERKDLLAWCDEC